MFVQYCVQPSVQLVFEGVRRDTIEEMSPIFCEAVMGECVHLLCSSLRSLDVAQLSLPDVVVDPQPHVLLGFCKQITK